MKTTCHFERVTMERGEISPDNTIAHRRFLPPVEMTKK
jgi:hypothetical protein